MPPLPEAARHMSPRDLRTDPLWQADDLGKPIPDSPHAVSVALPMWEHVIGYEEQDPKVIGAMACGYPRFFFHPAVQRLFRHCEERHAGPGERCLAFPSERIACMCADFVRDKTGLTCRVATLDTHGLAAVVLPEAAFQTAKKFWQHSGEVVSSRLAEAALNRAAIPPGGAEAKAQLRARIAGWTSASPGDVTLYPSGMAALIAAQRLLQARKPGAKTVQLGFPYVDLLKIQDQLGMGSHFFPSVGETQYAELEDLVKSEPIAGVFCEFPGNPLLQSLDVPRLSAMLRRHGVPLVIDETLAGFCNADLLPHADILATSLTKYTAGTGDVLAGSLVLNPVGPHYAQLQAVMPGVFEDVFYDADALVLEQCSRDFPERMARINTTASRLCAHLRSHPAIEAVYYPEFVGKANYDTVRRPSGGYSGLFSVLLKDADRTAQPFYDRLRVSKGPTLGTNFTLACPYVLLAHYDELDWAESLGVSRYLVRVSVGLEDSDDLVSRFDEALKRLP